MSQSALWQSNCLFYVQTQLQRSSRRLFFCPGGILVLFNGSMMAILSMPAVDCTPHALPDNISHQHSVPSSRPRCGRPSLARKGLLLADASPSHEECCESQPPVHRTSPHHSHNSARHTRAQRNLWSLFCPAPQLSQTLVGGIVHGINEVPFGEDRQHSVTASTSVFRAPETFHHCRRERLRKTTNTQSRWLLSAMAMVPIECAWKQ